MVYQRRMPRRELFSTQLELLMQNGRSMVVVIHMVGIAATVTMLWPYIGLLQSLLWATGFLALLLLRSLHMNHALRVRSYLTAPRRLYWQLLLGVMLSGAVWSAVYIFTVDQLPLALQYALLLLIISIAAFSIGFAVIVREYFLAHVFTSLWPVAWWSTVHYWQQSYNLLIGLSLLGYCGILMLVCNQIYLSFSQVLNLNWEREQTAQELEDMTDSLRLRNRELQQARAKLSNLANIDELTGLGNRRLANEVLREELNRAQRNRTGLSLILLDVDYFKSYNDTYGHPAGDVVLRSLASLMQRACARAGEVVARYGGEEFLLLLPGADAAAAGETARRLQALVLEERIPHEGSDVAGYITVSQGVITVSPGQALTPAEIILRADALLYRAKDAGRNAIVKES